MKNETNERIDRFRILLEKSGIDAALLMHPRDVFYYAGTMRPASLLVTKDAAVLFVRRGYDRAWREATIKRVQLSAGFDSIAKILDSSGGQLGTELDVVPVQLVQRLAATFPDWSLADVSPLVLTQRSVKDLDEISTIRQAAGIADDALRLAPEYIDVGVTELELATEVEMVMRAAGHEAHVPIRSRNMVMGGVLVMSGTNLAIRGGYGRVVTGAGLSPAMPYGPSRREFRLRNLVVVDANVTFEGYSADAARTFVVGEATPGNKVLHSVALAAEDAVFQALKPGVTGAELFAVAETVVKEGSRPYYAQGSLALPEFVGHGVGLEADELPVLDARETLVMMPGMTLAIEVEVSAISTRKMVKIEDTVLVTEDGFELLTSAPRELIECEVEVLESDAEATEGEVEVSES